MGTMPTRKAIVETISERESRKAAAKKIIMLMSEKWKAPFVPRSKVKSFTEGLYSPEYLANCDSSGTGPENSFKIGRQTVYPVLEFCKWLITKIET